MKALILLICVNFFLCCESYSQSNCPCVYGRSLFWTNATGNGLWQDGNNWLLQTIPSPYDTCGGQIISPRYCDKVFIPNLGSAQTINLGAEGLVIGYGQRPPGLPSQCRTLELFDASVYFNGPQITVAGVDGNLSLRGTSEIRTQPGANFNVGGGFHPLPNRFISLSMTSDCGIYAGQIFISGETEITRSKLDATRILLGGGTDDMEISIQNSNIYGDINYDTGKVSLFAVNIYPRTQLYLPAGIVSTNCNVIFDTLVSSNAPSIFLGEGRAFGGNIYSNKKNNDFTLFLEGAGNGLRYINGELKIDAGTLNITSPYQFFKVTASPAVNINVKSNILIK